MTALAELIGDSPALVDVRAQVEQLLRRHSQTRRLPPVLMLGETGTGKGLLARALHDAGPRADGPFVAVNCMTLPETLMEAELFGFERGAFTGAHQAKAGLFQTAHRGTLFLDEIGLLPEQLQAKLLTAIENRSVRRLGSTRPEPVDVWIITATSEDIEGAARGRGFREELFHRIAVVTLRLPPLRERGDDILTLAGHFLARACREDGLTPKTLADDARTVLLGYRWPGNVRELSNQMRRAALLTDDLVVTADTLDLPAPRARRASPVSVEDDASGARTREATLDQAVRGAEGARILAMLDETRGNVSHAADRLGVTRNRLRYRMQKYGLQAASRPAEPTPLSEPVSGTEAPRAAPRRLHVQWERRHVALLRVDLVAPSAAVLDTTPVLETLVANVHKFGGQVDEVSPRGLVAAFGLEPVEDAVRRAAHAALAMQNIAGHDRVGPLSGVRLGLHVAEVLLGRFDGAARIDYAAKRDAWAALEAFMGSAEPGTVLVSEATRPFLERHFALASFTAGDATVGTVHRLSGLPRSGLGAGERLTPFVARGRELEHLAEALEHAVDGHGQVVGVIGEPGIGKSRLFWEFGRSLRLRNARLLVAGAASYGQATPYLPVVDLLKAYFHIEARDTLEQIRKQVTAKALSLDQGLASTLPAILALLDVPVDDPHWTVLDASQKQRKTLEAVTRLLVEESRRQPVVIVFEDLHWIDAKTQELLDAFADRIPGHRVLLLLSYRPEYRHGWSSRSYYAQLRLDPLPPDGAHLLLDSLLGRDEDLATLTGLLIDRTGGNPFFLEESVRTLVETGALAGDRGAYRVARRPQDLEIPATVQAVLAARIERLAPEDKTLLETAAVIGKDVPFALLQAVAARSEESLQAGLSRLRGSEFLSATRLVPELEYAFKHALSHEAAYAGVLEDQRRMLHARTLQAIEALHAGRLTEHVDRLAHHALLGEVWDKAVAYLHQAGAKAAGRSAYREAVAWFEQALGALSHLPESREAVEEGIDLRLSLRSALFPLMENRQIGDRLHEATILAERIRDAGRLGWISAYTCAHFWITGDPTRGLAPGQQAVAVARARGDFPLQVVANVRLGQVYFALGDFRRACECCQRNIDGLGDDVIHERFGEPFLPSVLSRTFLVRSLAELGAFADGLMRAEEALRIAERLDQRDSVLATCQALGFLHLRRGALDDAIRWLERGRGLCEAWNIRTYRSAVTARLGYAYALSGRHADGLRLLEEGMAIGVSQGELNGQAAHLADLSHALLLAGRSRDALEAATRGIERARSTRHAAHEAWAAWALGEAESHRDPVNAEDAVAAYRQAMALAEERGMRPLLAHCHLGLGRLQRRLDKRQQAQEHVTAATTMYREMDMRFWLEQAEHEGRAP